MSHFLHCDIHVAFKAMIDAYAVRLLVSRPRSSLKFRAYNSAVECCLHTAEVTGSNPVMPTSYSKPKAASEM